MTTARNYFSACLLLVLSPMALSRPDARTKILVADCSQLRRAVTKSFVVLEVSKLIKCTESEWGSTAVAGKDITVVGRRKTGVDFSNFSYPAVQVNNSRIRFEVMVFLGSGLEDNSLPTFVEVRGKSIVEFTGATVGFLKCTNYRDTNKTEEKSLQMAIKKSAGQSVDNGLGETTWTFCQTTFLCHSGDLKGLVELGNINMARNSISECPKLIEGAGWVSEGGELSQSKTWGQSLKLAGVVVIICVFLAGVSVCTFYLLGRKRKKVAFESPRPDKPQGSHRTPIEVHYTHLPTAKRTSSKVLNANAGDVRLGSLLGKGSFGSVYKGLWCGAPVAVKVVKHEAEVFPQELLEAHLGNAVVHPNVVRTYCNQVRLRTSEDLEIRASESVSIDDPAMHRSCRTHASASSDVFSDIADTLCTTGQNEYETWIVMEHCDLGSLQSAIRRGHFCEDRENFKPELVTVLLTALDVAMAMAHLHSLCIIHGDLTSRNVLLKTNRADIRGFSCKVADFGLSRIVSTISHLTTVSCGSVACMPPELLRDGILTPAADVYSYGILLWGLVAGCKPFRGKSHSEIIMIVTGGRRPGIPAQCPAWYTQMIGMCWQQDHHARPKFTDIVTILQQRMKEYGMDWQALRRGQCEEISTDWRMGLSVNSQPRPVLHPVWEGHVRGIKLVADG